MAKPFWEEDLPALYADFGVAAIWRDANRDYDVEVIFDDPFQRAELQETDVSTTSPVARGRADQFDGVVAGDTLLVSRDAVTTTYQILEVQPDGLGDLVFKLSEDTGN